MISKLVPQIMFKLYCVVLVIGICFSLVLGMPDGAPLEACTTMTPKHQNNQPKSLDTAIHELQVNFKYSHDQSGQVLEC